LIDWLRISKIRLVIRTQTSRFRSTFIQSKQLSAT